jgi:phosphatidylserine decarboxylase
MVRQIAGLVARRIVTDPKEGELVPQGTRIGIIRFGSRVDLFLPLEWEVNCRVGDRTKGGLTTMARVPRDTEGKV